MLGISLLQTCVWVWNLPDLLFLLGAVCPAVHIWARAIWVLHMSVTLGALSRPRLLAVQCSDAKVIQSNPEI